MDERRDKPETDGGLRKRETWQPRLPRVKRLTCSWFVERVIMSCFHQYSGTDHGFTCGQKSIVMEVTGKLQTSPPQRPLLFNSPVDSVCSTLLPCFKARYKVLSYEIMKSTVPSPVPEVPEPPRSPSALKIPVMPLRNRKLAESAVALREEIQKEFAEWAPSDDETLSAEEWELAAKVADHMFMLELLERIHRDASWPEDNWILPVQPLFANCPLRRLWCQKNRRKLQNLCFPGSGKRESPRLKMQPFQLAPVLQCAVPTVKLAAYLSQRDRSHNASTFSQSAFDPSMPRTARYVPRWSLFTVCRSNRTGYLMLGLRYSSRSLKTSPIKYMMTSGIRGMHSF